MNTASITTTDANAGHHNGDGHVGHEHHGVVTLAADSASVALDIGPGRGALVLYPSKRYRGREIEISRVGGTGHRVHTGVHERTTQTRSLLTAIFGSLPAGEYVVWEDAATSGPVVTVPEGGIAEVAVS